MRNNAVKETVTVRLIDVRNLKPVEAQCLPLLTPERGKAAEGYQDQTARLRVIGAGLLLRKVLGVERGSDLAQNEYGKPFLAAGGPQFSLSNSGHYAALAVARVPVGLDIEQIKDNYPPVLRRYFLPDELEWLDRAPSDEWFYTLWTRLESALKAEGVGFERWKQRKYSLLKENGPRFIRNAIHDGHMIACTAGKPFCLRLINVNTAYLLK